MRRNSAEDAVNEQIANYLTDFDPEVRELAMTAIRLAHGLGVPAVVEQMTAHIKSHARAAKDIG